MANTLDISFTSVSVCICDSIPMLILKGGLNCLGLSLLLCLDDYVVPAPSRKEITILILSNFPNIVYNFFANRVLKFTKQLGCKHLVSDDML